MESRNYPNQVKLQCNVDGQIFFFFYHNVKASALDLSKQCLRSKF